MFALPAGLPLVLVGTPASSAGAEVCAVAAAPTDSEAHAGSVMDLAPAQVTNARTVVAAAKAAGLPVQAAVIGLMTAMQESSLENLANPSVPASESYPHDGDGSDHDSVGVFQQRPSQGWGTVPQLMQPTFQAAGFMIRLAQVPGWSSMTPEAAAQTVQRSADGSAYARWWGFGQAAAAAMWSSTAGGLSCTATTASPDGTSSAAAQIAVSYAVAQLGKPYLFGGNGPAAFDCSGLVQQAYLAAGVTLPRVSSLQWLASPRVSLADLQPGDLVFYNPDPSVNGLPGHVGIYIGGGLMIHAPHTGDVVRVAPVDDGDTYVGATRPSD